MPSLIFSENFGFKSKNKINMGPLIPNGIIGSGWDFVIAIVLGIAFGFILEASGFFIITEYCRRILWL